MPDAAETGPLPASGRGLGVGSATVASRPYPWPYHGAIRPAQTALLILSGDGDTEVDVATLDRLVAFVETARREGITVITLPHTGPRAVPPIAVDGGELEVPRPHFGAFHGTNIDTVLRRRGLTDLLFAGFPFELGADCTMREANDRGYECLVLEDACSSVSPQTFAGAIRTLEASGGIFGTAAPVAAVIDALSRSCTGG
jgi:nicotinamidase-related amidase